MHLSVVDSGKIIIFVFKETAMPYIILIIYLAVAIALHILTGTIPVSFFAFPLNLILAALWLGSVMSLWRYRRKSIFVRFMLSRGAALWAIILMIVFSLAVGLSGHRHLATTWPFAAMMLYFQTVITFIILRGWRRPTATGARLGAIRWRFLLNHTGLLLAVASAFWSAPDSETLRLQALRNTPVREAYNMDGTSRWLPYEIVLDEFSVSHYENGTPSMYEAELTIDGESVVLRVNEPYSKSFGEDIYLSGYDKSDSVRPDWCVLQIVREPWKYPALAGIMMMLAGAFLLFVGGPQKRNEDD